ncbi:hypothetical protein F5884DRAFT_858081 [Xylogone sp. PMI_703]|nr:hypothetical protein F5884DRAFT_858081 [Xylogone sp. PMI_703]
MSRDGYSPRDNYSPRSSQRWDSERFTVERDRERDRYEDRYSEFDRDVRYRGGGGYGRPRERSVDRIYERRGPHSFEDDRFKERIFYDDDPRHDRDRIRREAVTIEKERISSPSPPRRPFPRPGLIRRQSSLDTFDRQPLSRIIRERDEERYGPPARREELRPPPLNPVRLPRERRDLRRYEERDYEEIKISDPDYYGDDLYRPYPERIKEKEIIKERRRSRRRSVSSSSSSESDRETVKSIKSSKSEYPKRGKTRIPGKLVSKKAIIDLGYPFEEDGTTIVILKALGREHIDQVIQLSEVYKSEKKERKEKKEKVTTETQLTTYVVTPEDHHHHHRHHDHHDDSSSNSSETIIEERREIYTIPPRTNLEIIRDKEVVERRHSRSPGPGRRHHHHHHNAIIIDAGKPRDYERSDPIPVGPLALAVPERSRRDEHSIRAEIRALEAEKEALRAEKRADEELRRASSLRRGRDELVVYEKDRYVDKDEVLVLKKEKIIEPEGGVRIEKDRKGKMSISVPKYLYR